jgi:hypothetical protein
MMPSGPQWRWQIDCGMRGNLTARPFWTRQLAPWARLFLPDCQKPPVIFGARGVGNGRPISLFR